MSMSILAGVFPIDTRLQTGVFSETAPTTLFRSRGQPKNPALSGRRLRSTNPPVVGSIGPRLPQVLVAPRCQKFLPQGRLLRP